MHRARLPALELRTLGSALGLGTDIVRGADLQHPTLILNRVHYLGPSGNRTDSKLVERCSSALATKKLQHSAHDSVAALAAENHRLGRPGTRTPKPFIGRKSPDEILDRIRRYCHAVNH